MLKPRAAVLAATALAAAAFASPAHAVGVGVFEPPSAAFGNFPPSFTDAIGQQLELCLDGPQCLATIERPDPAAPVSFPGNFPLEAFWFEADTAIGLNAIYVAAQEAVFVNENVVDGDQGGMGRVRIRVFSGLETGAPYRITHPYGQMDVIAGTAPRQVNVTDDIGCLAPPCDTKWGALAGSAVGPNFLQWDTRVSAPPAGWIGDSLTPHAVVGSPFNTNYFKVEKLDKVGGTPVSTAMFSDQFNVQGKLAAGAAPAGWLSAPTSSNAGEQLVAKTSPSKNLALADSGGAPLTISSITLGGPNAADFALDQSACGATLAVGQSCNLAYTFTPSAAGERKAVVTITTNLGVQTIDLVGTGTEPVAPAPAAAPVAAPAPAPVVVKAPNAVKVPKLRLQSLSISSRAKLKTVRTRGLRAVVFAPEGAKVIKARLLRNGHVVARVTKAVSADGITVVVLPSTKSARRGLKRGTYQLQVTPGQSATQYGVTTKRTIRVR